ncbi:SURF1 family protein [Actinomycetota bacterium]
MLQIARRPKWLGLLALLAVAIAVCLRLAAWQLGVAQDKGEVDAVKAAASRPVVDISRVLTPHSGFPADASARRVSATGAYAAEHQVLVSPRRLDGVTGSWVVTPLVIDSPRVTVPVVRGFVSDPAAAPEPPSGKVTVVMGLAPGESPTTGSVESGTMGSVDLAKYVNAMPGDFYNAFGFAISEDPAAPASAMQAVPPPLPDHGVKWRNAAYAGQWVIFAGFAVYMYWRAMRDEYDDEQEARAEALAEKETSPT